MRQVVQVGIMGTSRLFTYGWDCDPLQGVPPLKVGDKVELPPNIVQEQGSSGTVVKYGSDYTGPVKMIIRKIEQPPADAGGLWEGFGDGDYA